MNTSYELGKEDCGFLRFASLLCALRTFGLMALNAAPMAGLLDMIANICCSAFLGARTLVTVPKPRFF